MKKILSILFIFITCFVFTACNKGPKVTESSELKFDAIIDYEDCCFKMSYDFGKEKNNFVETGFIYVINYEGTEKLTVDSENLNFRLIDINKEDKTCTISFISSKSKVTSYTFRGYIKRSNGNIIYSEDQKTFDVELGKIIFTLSLDIDIKNYKFINADNDVNVEITPSSDYKTVTITVTPNNDLIFFSRVSVKINCDDILKFDTKLENNILTITFDDPNWTEIY